ncbi:MAG: hypothetical protein KDK48_02605 [Chlamydiia bacterium]|nr:hypothetical protein [Chlamydiia bacterium]
MHRNPVWIAFILFVAAITAYFSFVAIKGVYDYSVLSETTTTTEITFSVSQIALDAYAPKASYIFSVHGHSFEGEEILSTYAANPEYIEELIPTLQSSPHAVYYDPEDPEINALEKDFPLAALIKAGLMIALAFYFAWLGFYVRYSA